MLKVDLHVHTHCSPDCATPPEVILNQCLRREISCIAVTDHNTIVGALEMQQLAASLPGSDPIQIIVGEEIKTTMGEIIGLFLTEVIPRDLSPDETVTLIKAQGGLVCIPHPFDRLRNSRLNHETLEALVSYVDIIEAFNSRTTLRRDSARAEAFGRSHGLALGAGSDAHTPLEIGGAYVEMAEFQDPQEFLEVLRQGRVFGKRANPLVHVATRAIKILKRMRRNG